VSALQETRSAESATFPEEAQPAAFENRVLKPVPVLRSKSTERRSVDRLAVSTSGRLPSISKPHHFGLSGYPYSRKNKKVCGIHVQLLSYLAPRCECQDS